MNEIDILVKIDTREPDIDKVVKKIKMKLEEEGIKYVDAPLPVGDYAIYLDGELAMIIERKTVSDYFSSLYRGRLEEQWKRGEGLPVMVVITGSLWGYLRFVESRMRNEGKGKEETEREIEKRIKIFNHSIAANTLGGRITIYVPNEDFSDWLIGVIKILERGVRPRIYTEKRYDTLGDAQITLVGALPSVGAVRAEELLRHFGSPIEIFNASEDELAGVPGVGKKIASLIRATLDTPFDIADQLKMDRVLPLRRTKREN